MAQKTFNDTKINVKFDEATSRQQLNSGENISTLFGKIKKIFSDLKAICFSGSYNDLSDTPTTATTDSDGLMSASDKTKLDNIENEANKIVLDTELSDTSENPVQNKIVNTAIAETQDLANSMLKDVVNVVVNPTTSTGNSVNETKYENTTGIAFSRGNGEYVSGQNFTNTYYKYGNANASKDGLLSAEDFAFIDKYKKIRNSYAAYTLTANLDTISLGYHNCFCRNGLVVLTGWFISSSTVGNAFFATGSFPSHSNSFMCGIVVNIDSPNTNTRLLVRTLSDGTSGLQCGGTISAGTNFFIAVYPTEVCTNNLPYKL